MSVDTGKILTYIVKFYVKNNNRPKRLSYEQPLKYAETRNSFKYVLRIYS